MPVRHLDYYYTTQRNLISVHPLSTLKDTRLGIDGNAWVKKISITAASEQYLAGIGGVPPKLRKAVEKELEGFKSQGIHPLFMFSGLNLMRKDKPSVNEGGKIAKRNVAWDAVHNGKLEQAQSSWSSSNFVHQSELVHLVIRILKEHGMNYMKAPYGAGAQLAYLERNPKQIVHAISGGSELLMFDVDRVITNIDFEKSTFSVISKKALLQDLQLSDDQFLDLCILAGFDHCPTFPPLTMDVSFTFRNLLDLLRTHRTGFNAVKAYADSPAVVNSNYVDVYMRTRCAMRFQPVLTTEGHIEPLNAEQAPSDIHEFIGFRLPDEVYYYLSRGVISEFALNVLLSGYNVEYSPLCNGETEEYRNLLKTTVFGIKAQTLANLTAHLYSFYRDRRVLAIYWFESGTAAPEHPIKEDAAPVKASETANWKTGKNTIKDEKATFAAALATVATPADAASTVRPPNADKVALETQVEIHARHLLKLLQLRSFLDGKHELGPYGKAMLAGNKVQSNKTSFQDELFVALELIRAGVLSNRPYSITYTKMTQSIQDDAVANASRLISRTCSILNGRFVGTKPWTGPLNRDLLVFNSMHRSVNKNLRYLSEAVLLEMLLANECNKEKVDYSELGTTTPFAYESSAVLGILVQQYIEIVANSPSFTPDQAVQQLEKQLGSAATALFSHSIKEELTRAFDFWQAVAAAAASLGETGAIAKEAAKEFADADAWLAKYRVRA